MEEFQDGEINISVADAAASLEPELQKIAYEMYMKNKILTLPDIQLLKDQAGIKCRHSGTDDNRAGNQAAEAHRRRDANSRRTADRRFFDSLKRTQQLGSAMETS